MNKNNILNKYLLVFVAIIGLWSVYQPHDYFTWWLESFPIFIGLPILFVTREKFRLTPLLYTLLSIHAVILLVGAHYTYAEVPLGHWAKDIFGFERNHYDRVGHLAQGFIPAIVARELLIRTSPLKPGRWMFTLIVLGCTGISALYEILEWMVAVMTGEAAEAFLGTQGDVWDTQTDMVLAFLGAVLALVTLSGVHNRQLQKLKKR